MVRDMRMSSAQLLGETGASSSGGSFHFGFHSHLQPCDHNVIGTASYAVEHCA